MTKKILKSTSTGKVAKNANSFNLNSELPLTKIDAEKSAFIERSIRQVEDFASAFAESETINHENRIAALRRMCRILAQQVEDAIIEPEMPNILYKDRSEYQITATDFVKKHYSHVVNDGLSLAHIGKHDPYLYNMLLKERRANHNQWPNGFELPTKEELIDRELAQYTEYQTFSFGRLATNSRRRKKKS